MPWWGIALIAAGAFALGAGTGYAIALLQVGSGIGRAF
jgi:hypothetical protein